MTVLSQIIANCDELGTTDHSSKLPLTMLYCWTSYLRLSMTPLMETNLFILFDMLRPCSWVFLQASLACCLLMESPDLLEHNVDHNDNVDYWKLTKAVTSNGLFNVVVNNCSREGTLYKTSTITMFYGLPMPTVFLAENSIISLIFIKNVDQIQNIFLIFGSKAKVIGLIDKAMLERKFSFELFGD